VIGEPLGGAIEIERRSSRSQPITRAMLGEALVVLEPIELRHA